MNEVLVNVGKSKAFYKGQKEDQYLMRFLDNVCARGGDKTARIFGTGAVRSIICETLFNHLHNKGIPTHYIQTVKVGEFEVKRLNMFKLEVIPRNYAAGSACVRFPLTRGHRFDPPVLKLDMKYGDDPMLNTDYALALGIATRDELQEIRELAFETNRVLTEFFDQKGLLLVDFKFEVGKTDDNKIVIGDEISCDGFRVWDKETHRSLDKDVFRYDWADLLETYKQLAERIVPGFENKKEVFLNNVW